MDLSVIIPIAPNDESWRSLLPDLFFLTEKDEIIMVSPNSRPVNLGDFNLKANIFWINSDLGRAIQLNIGAKKARNEFLWFLHSDSKINQKSYEILIRRIDSKLDALYYFDLKFLNDGSKLMFLNQVGTFIRSRLFSIPFGDQAFCIRRDLFNLLKGFDESCSYGEDHLFVWKARINNIQIISVGESIYTSARKYKKNGWLTTTIDHLLKTYEQAFPQMIKLIRGKL